MYARRLHMTFIPIRVVNNIGVNGVVDVQFTCDRLGDGEKKR
jgi:hypothetical protein